MSDKPRPESDKRKASDTSGLSAAQRETLKSLLETNRRQLLAQYGTDGTHDKQSPFTSGRERDEELHVLEDAEINVELHEHAKQELVLIDAALKRLEFGSYGVCCDCDNAIGFPRLEAYPMARRCITCKTEYEQRQ